jgi:hypothetical protein
MPQLHLPMFPTGVTHITSDPAGQEQIAWSKMAAILVAARFCEPSSELHIAEDWYRRTTLCDLPQPFL